jgi:hypothetical protein
MTMITRSLAIVAVAACGGTSTVETRTMAAADLACEVSVDGAHLMFVLVNATSAPRTLRYHEPYMEFALIVTDRAGAKRTLEQPPLDFPVRAAELVVPPHGRATLPTPIQLRFASDPSSAPDPFTWTLSGARAPLDLDVTLRFDDDASTVACRGTM